MVRQMLMSRSAPQPDTRKTPMGGQRMVMRTMRSAGAASDIVPWLVRSLSRNSRLVIKQEETRFCLSKLGGYPLICVARDRVDRKAIEVAGVTCRNLQQYSMPR